MSEPASAMPSSCTLAAPAFGVREAEFRSLFARALRDSEDVRERSVRLRLDPACEPELRDLLARERECCSFFEFELALTPEAAALRVGVPAGSEDALAFLLGLRPAT
jgi:hypothetical protein